MKSIVGTVRRSSVVGLLFLFQLLISHLAGASDVSAYTAQMGIDYTQLSSLVASPDTNNGYILQSTLDCLAGKVTGSTVQPPGQLALALIAQAGNAQFKYRKEYDSLSKLNSHSPSGYYAFVMNTVDDGIRTPSLLLQGDLYPATPHLLVFDAAQSLDAGSYFNVRWDYLADGVFPDFVQIRIEDSLGNAVFESADRGRGALNGADTSVLLSPNMLAPNQVYKGSIIAVKTITTDTNTYPGASGTAYYYKRLKFRVATAPVASLSDVRLLEAIKLELYEQVSTNAPSPLTNNSFIFPSQVNTSSSNSVLTAAIATPGLGPTNMAASSSTRLEYEVKLDSLSQLNTHYPAGAYAFATQGATQGARNTTLSLPADQYLAPAQYVNVAAAGSINPTNDFVLQWLPVAGATSSDFIHLQIEDSLGTKVYETDDPGKPKALTGTRTSENIPDHTLSPGTQFTARLQFIKASSLDTTSYPGALGLAGFAKETRIGIATTRGALLAPRLTNVQWSALGVAFLLSGSANQTYRIDFSSDLINWNPLATVTTSGTGTNQFTDTNATGTGFRFYRAVAP